ncbi:MAG: hypothetical protein JWQ87_3428 [Candidatus Sulfotelmatobacter sp.]|nr:hypothetical protein [Candidatus Sulfotelmatobacter sp.]
MTSAEADSPPILDSEDSGSIVSLRGQFSFDFTAQAGGSRFVLDAQPDERHDADDLADRALQFDFPRLDILRGRVALAPCRKFMPVAGYQCRADDQPKDRAPVIAAAVAQLAPVRRQAPQSVVLPLAFSA